METEKQKIRREIATAVFNGLLSQGSFKNDASYAVRCADALISELEKEE